MSLSLVLLSLACAPEDRGPVAVADSGTGGDGLGGEAEVLAVEPLPAPRLLRRLSLDLRGVLPTVEELDAVEADAALVSTYRDAWLDDPRFEERLVHLYAERWLTRTDQYLVQPEEYFAAEDEAYAFYRMVGDEPVRLLARVIADDRPWSEVVTADWTMATSRTASVWPVTDPGGDGWGEAVYTDGRPAAGVLATNGLWWRYFSTVTNYNRGRVAALTRLLICEDYQARVVSFADASESIGEAEEIEDALRETPYCMGCHSSLDPIAANLFGFWPANEYNIDEIATYHPEREAQGAVQLGVQPSWYGDPTNGLSDLGEHIAADPRFDRCAVQTAASLLWRREVEVADFDRVEALRDVYDDAGGRMKPVFAAITDGPVYRAGGLTDAAGDDVAERENTLRMLSPDQVESAIADLTGFQWTWTGARLMDDDRIGFRIMAGGVDGELSTAPLDTPNLTTVLVLQRLAEAAADHAVPLDLSGSGPGLLGEVDGDSRPGDAAFDAALGDLAWRAHGERLDDAHRSDLVALWQAVEADHGASAAWEAVVVLLLRDPLFLSY